MKSGSAKKPDSDVFAEVRAIYQELADRPVRRNCMARTECCQFQLPGRIPQLTKGEALLAARADRATGRRELPETEDGTCPMLQRPAGRCLIHADQPFGGRTHFCDAAGGPYARRDVLDLIRRLEDLNVRLKGDGPRNIAVSVADALADSR